MLPEHLKHLEGVKHKVLDQGFVQLIDVMGDDQRIEQAARTSYGEGTRKVSETRGLIRYLLRHWHTTPFEMCEVTFLVQVPMDAWRQWIRHRTANVNEYSTRYSIAMSEMQGTKPDEWRLQAKRNKQGSSGFLPEYGEKGDRQGAFLSKQEENLQRAARTAYEGRLKLGVAREQARKDLPLSTYTLAYWKIDLHNLFHFLRLRLDSHAQFEIRVYAEAMAEIVKQWCPLAWEAFCDFRLNAVNFSAAEMKIVRKLIPAADLVEYSMDELSKREQREFKAKVGLG